MPDAAQLPTDRPLATPNGFAPSPGRWRNRVAGLRSRESLALWMVLPLALALLSWRKVHLQGGHDLDQSWSAALHMAAQMGVGFGNHLVFTYGPLGFLSAPELWYTGTGVAAFSYLFLLRLATAAAIFAAARRNYGPLVGFVVALLVASVIDQTLEPIAFLILGVLALERAHIRSNALALACVAGAIAGIQLLNKESVGIELSVLAIGFAAILPGRRLLVCATIASLLTGLLAGWLAAGQSVSALPDYVHNAAQIVLGYAGAMAVDSRTLFWEYPAACIVFAAGLLAALQSAPADVRRRWGLVALWTVFAFFSFKEGFVRHDVNHGLTYFEATLGGLLAFSWAAGSRWTGLGLTAGVFAVTLAAHMSPVTGLVSPISNASSAANQVRQVFTPSDRARTIAAARHSVEATYPIDAKTMALLRGHTVHVAPLDAVVAWAYRLNWRPLPVFQSYSSYTSGLDQLDANTLTSARAPERILVDAPGAIDGRLPWAEEPLTSRTILCRYRELRTTSTWDLLGRVPNRCAKPTPLGTIRTTWGKPVTVPVAPDLHSVVFVRISGVAVGGLDRIRALYYKPPERFITLDEYRTYRLVTATAGDGIMLHAPFGVDLRRRFKMAPESRSISVMKSVQGDPGGGTVTYSFFAQVVAPAPPGP